MKDRYWILEIIIASILLLATIASSYTQVDVTAPINITASSSNITFNETALNDSAVVKNVTFLAVNRTLYITLPKNSEVLNASINLTGYNDTEYDAGAYNYTGSEAAGGFGQTFYYWFNISYGGNLSKIKAHVYPYNTPTTCLGNISICRVSGYGIGTCDAGTEKVLTDLWNITENLTNAPDFTWGYDNFTFNESYRLSEDNVYRIKFAGNCGSSYWLFSDVVRASCPHGNNYQFDDLAVHCRNSGFRLVIESNLTNPYIDVGADGDKDWQFVGEFRGIPTAANNITEVNNYLTTCTADANGNCNVSFVMHSDSAGIFGLSQINMTYRYNTSYLFTSVQNASWGNTTKITVGDKVSKARWIKNTTNLTSVNVATSGYYIDNYSTACSINGTLQTMQVYNANKYCPNASTMAAGNNWRNVYLWCENCSEITAVDKPLSKTEGSYIQLGTAWVNKNVSFTKDVVIRNDDDAYDQTFYEFLVNASLPTCTKNITMIMNSTLQANVSSYSYAGGWVLWNFTNITDGQIQSHKIYFDIEGPNSTVTKTEVVGTTYKKWVEVNSSCIDVSNVWIEESINESVVGVLYDNTSGTPTIVTADVSWTDSNNNGLYDKVRWKIASLSTKKYYIETDVSGYSLGITITTEQVTDSPVQNQIIDWKDTYEICNDNNISIKWDDYKIYIPKGSLIVKWDGNEQRETFYDTYGNYFTIDETFDAYSCEEHYLEYNSPGLVQTETYDYPEYITVGELPKVYIYIDISNPTQNDVSSYMLQIQVRYGKDVKLYDRSHVISESAIEDEHKYKKIRDYSIPGAEERIYNIVYGVPEIPAGGTQKYMVFFRMPWVRMQSRGEVSEVLEGIQVNKIVVRYKNEAPIKYENVKGVEAPSADYARVVKCVDRAGKLLECRGYPPRGTITVDLGSLDSQEEGQYIIYYEPEVKPWTFEWVMHPFEALKNWIVDRLSGFAKWFTDNISKFISVINIF